MIYQNNQDEFLLFWNAGPMNGYMHFTETIPGECEALFYFKPGFYKILGTQRWSCNGVSARYLRAVRVSAFRFHTTRFFGRLLKRFGFWNPQPLWLKAGYLE